MNLEKVIEFVFSLVILLFVGVFIVVSLIIISVVQELNRFDVSENWRIVISFSLVLNLIYLIRLIVLRFKEYHRYI